MQLNSEAYNPPPTSVDAGDEASKEVVDPAVLLLAGEYILGESAASMPLYQLSRSVISFSPKQDSTVIFERVEHQLPEKATSTEPTKQRNRCLFYLVHPLGAEYQTDIPAYYITSMSPGMIGNIQFETSKPRFQKKEFRALLSANKSASDRSLFDKKAQQQLLFSVKPKWMGDRYKWTDPNGGEIAFEDSKDDQYKLVVTAHMQREMRDALAAMWALRLWHDTAECRQAKRESKLVPCETSLELLHCHVG